MSDAPVKKERRKRNNVQYIPLIGIDARYLHYLKPFGGLLAISVLLLLGRRCRTSLPPGR